jgi:hypothetical protein
MRKLIVLVSALLLVSMVAIASDTTFSGEVEQRWANDFNNKNYEQGPVVELKIDVVVDDTASLYLELEEGTSGIDVATAPFDKAFFTLDLGGIFDLPVGVTVRTGWDEYDQFDAVKVTFGEYEDIIGSDKQTWGHEINVAATEQIAFRVLWANDPGEEYYSAGVAVTYDPIYVEVSYVNIDAVVEDAAKGDIEAGVEFMQEVADGIDVAAAATLDFDLEDATLGESHWAYGAALQGTYNDMVTVGAALRGEQDSAAQSLQVDISATPVEAVTLFLVAGIGLDSDIYADAFESFEGSAMFMIGPSTWYAGLLWSAESAVNVIASEKADFVAEVPDMMAIFMRAELKY